MKLKLIEGDVLQILKQLEPESVQCVVTSPPYWGLRDYGKGMDLVWGGQKNCEHEWDSHYQSTKAPNRPDNMPKGPALRTGKPIETQFCLKCNAWCGQLGLEPTPGLYLEHMVEVFREIRRALRKDGTVWLNLGDSYASGQGSCFNPGGGENSLGIPRKEAGALPLSRGNISDLKKSGLKPKDLCGIPWRVAFALQADGWWLRSDIIWAKLNPMPEAIGDRPTRSHEYLFLLTKSARYYWDQDAVREPQSPHTLEAFKDGKRPRNPKAINNPAEIKAGKTKQAMWNKIEWYAEVPGGRNIRSVWTIPTQPFPGTFCEACRKYYHKGTKRLPDHVDEKGKKHKVCECGAWDRWLSHFATFPEKLVEPCVKAGTSEKGCCPECGSPWERVSVRIETGKTQKMADGWAIGPGGHGTIHGKAGKPQYIEMARRRIEGDAPLFNRVAVE